jgi:hypothetical protein
MRIPASQDGRVESGLEIDEEPRFFSLLVPLYDGL